MYLLTCNMCKMQYVGKTVDDFCLRWLITKTMIGNTLAKKHAWNNIFLEHFSGEDHNGFLDNVYIIFIDLKIIIIILNWS